MIDTRHELVRLAALIDWAWFEEHWAGLFPPLRGGLPPIPVWWPG
jgi:transposase, IS5 family